MQEYIVSARKYRPMTFDSVVGQMSLTTTLKNAVKSGKLAHAYLFCGPRGVGKTTCARIFAKVINCEHPTAEGEACGECESCKAFAEGRSYNIFELDAASNNTVESIKQLMDQTRVPPQIGHYKVFIIDEVHMLSTNAFNAFLKTLEEPPSHVIFILATTEKHKILPTILSRCQIYDFERMTVQNTVNHLKHVAEKEGITYEEEALTLIAEKADGGMRDALSIFDQAASYCQGNITYKKVVEDLNELDIDNYFRIVDLSIENKVSDIMLLLDSVISKGFDGGNLINGLATHIRSVLMAKDEKTLPLLETSDQQRQKYAEQAKKCPAAFLFKALKLLNQCDINYKQSSNKRLLVELTLIQVAQLTQPEDESAGAGRGPKRLKSLFKHIVASRPKVAQQVAAAGNAVRTDAAKASEARGMERDNTPTTSVSTTPAASTASSSSSSSTTSRPRPKLRGLGVTFAQLKEVKTEEKKADPVITNVEEDETFTQDLLDLQWRMMCNRMPQQMVALSMRMKNMAPVITDYPHFEVVIENQPLLEQVAAIRGRIRATMAQLLHNGHVDITLRLAAPSEIKPILSKREIFEMLTKNNKGVRRLVDELGLEFA